MKRDVHLFAKRSHFQTTLRHTRRWYWKPFLNEARADGYKLCHWEREDHIPNDPYVFAAEFNKVGNLNERHFYFYK